MELTAKFLAQLLKGTVEGDENAKATKFAKIEHGKPGTLSFFANPKYEEYVYTSQASILIVDKTFEPKQPVALLHALWQEGLSGSLQLCGPPRDHW